MVRCLAWFLGLCVCIAILGASGGTQSPIESLAIVIRRLTLAGWAPAVYLISGFGLASLARPLFRHASDPLALRIALGLGISLTMSQLLGSIGLLAGLSGRTVAWLLALAGILLLLNDARRSRSRMFDESGASAPPRHDSSDLRPTVGRPSPTTILAIIAIAPIGVLILAASSSPGWLWESEFGGFDALSYHLQLPQEWIAQGVIQPLTHNVYSYLPCYVESAFVHVGILGGASATPDGEDRIGLLADSGEALLSCQFLHAMIALVGVWLLGRAAKRLVNERPASGISTSGDFSSVQSEQTRGLFPFAALIALTVPWTLVTGSLAYNEMAVIALFAGAMIAAMDHNLSPFSRGTICAFLVGAACGAKPTSLLFVGIPVGIVLLGTLPARMWGRAVLSGVLVGLLTLAPWLTRNYLYGENPVFPALTSLFGSAHWNAEQVARFTEHHHFSGNLVDRLRLLFLADMSDPAGPRHRGLLHPQWFIFFPVSVLAAAAALFNHRTRHFALFLAIGVAAQLAAWLFITHLQSRFLIPLLVPCVLLISLAMDTDVVRPSRTREKVIRAAAMTFLIAQTAACLRTYWTQRSGNPTQFLAINPSLCAGGEVARLDPGERDAVFEAFPAAFIARTLPPHSRLILIGETTPLYFPPGTLYSTTWDRSPLADAVGRTMDSGQHVPAAASTDTVSNGAEQAWTEELRRAGATHAFINLSEIERLHRSGYLDPRLKPDVVRRWVGSNRVIRVWNGGRVLVGLGE